jgi:hypothetical protein
VESTALESELAEIEMLAQQARGEAARHEQRREAANSRFLELAAAGGDVAELVDAAQQALTLTRRAALMQSQVDVLEGKIKVLVRFRDATASRWVELEGFRHGARGGGGVPGGSAGVSGLLLPGSGYPGPGTDEPTVGDDPGAPVGGLSRVVLAAQEDLRRQIARTLHDGPAQSLTNIVLQAQIVERLIERDPALAHEEVRQLISMVQRTLDATKTFIFDVRPMVLDDLGLVPTLRRAARERGARARIPVEFESFGTDRRLPADLEGGLFRMIDDVLIGYLAGHPDGVRIRLDWADGVDARIERLGSSPAEAGAGQDSGVVESAEPMRRRRGKNRPDSEPAREVPAALMAMIEEQRAVESAETRAETDLPAAVWRDVQQRGATLGIAVEVLEDGLVVHLAVDD